MPKIELNGEFENGCPFKFKIEVKEALKLIAQTEDLNQKDAATYCGFKSVKTFLKLNIPTNANGRYSVEELAARKRSR